MAKPVIGLTTYPPGPGHGHHTPDDYVNAVVRAGGVPVLLPHVGVTMVEEWLSCVDGVVLIGGGDIDPEHYDGGRHDTIYNLNPARDDTELALARAVLARRLPTLAICRGLQLVNTVLGGTLHLHLPDVVGEKTLHRAPPREPVPHAIEVAPDSCLATLIGTESKSASWHHQAIDRLGAGLRPVAWAPDGVIEAVELDGHPQLIAVQWHPEITAGQDGAQQALFDHLIGMAASRRR